LYSNEKNGLQQFQMESFHPVKRLMDKKICQLMANKSVVCLLTNLPPDFVGGFLSLYQTSWQGIVIAWVKRADTNADRSGEGRS
jgi:hypothetical protein